MCHKQSNDSLFEFPALGRELEYVPLNSQLSVYNSNKKKINKPLIQHMLVPVRSDFYSESFYFITGTLFFGFFFFGFI